MFTMPIRSSGHRANLKHFKSVELLVGTTSGPSRGQISFGILLNTLLLKILEIGALKCRGAAHYGQQRLDCVNFVRWDREVVFVQNRKVRQLPRL